MTIRATVREDLRYSLTVGLILMFIVACIAIALVLALPKHLDNDPSTPTSWPHGDGDRVVITPRAAP